MKFNLILDMIWKLQINDDDAGPGAEEEECNDDLDIGGGVGISTLDHSLEPGLTPPNVSTSVRSVRPNWTEKKLTNLGSVYAKKKVMWLKLMSFSF